MDRSTPKESATAAAPFERRWPEKELPEMRKSHVATMKQANKWCMIVTAVALVLLVAAGGLRRVLPHHGLGWQVFMVAMNTTAAVLLLGFSASFLLLVARNRDRHLLPATNDETSPVAASSASTVSADKESAPSASPTPKEQQTMCPSTEQIAEERAETDGAAKRLLRAAGFFSWGHDSWCHDQGGVGCVTTAEALDLLRTDEEIAKILLRPRVAA